MHGVGNKPQGVDDIALPRSVGTDESRERAELHAHILSQAPIVGDAQPLDHGSFVSRVDGRSHPDTEYLRRRPSFSRRMRLLPVCLFLVALLALGAPFVPPPGAADPSATRRALLSAINQERSRAGVPPLRLSEA